MYQPHGNSLNGKQKNQTTSESHVQTDLERTTPKPHNRNLKDDKFEQAVVLRQSPYWSRAIMLSLMALACFSIGWAYFAKIEQVIPAIGQLKPQGTVKEVQAPLSGVIKSVHIKDGQRVKQGDVLLTFDSTANFAELNSLSKIRTALIKENEIYYRLMDVSSQEATETEFLRGHISKEAVFLLKNRAALIAENQLMRTELTNSGIGADLQVDEQERLRVAKRELDSRAAAAQLEVEQTKQKLKQTQVQLGDAKASLAIDQQILGKMKTLAEEGAMAQLQYLQQQKQVQSLSAQVASLIEEEKRLQYNIEQGKQELQNTVDTTKKSILEKIADNKKRIAEIDSQLTKILVENQKKLADVNSKIAQRLVDLKYQELRAPVTGIVFDLQAKHPGYVANPSQTILKIVPNDKFIAEAFVTNKDIGFVREGMQVDVRVDSFPYSEFGDLKGEVMWVGSDALPPDQTHNYYRFPTKVRLDQQKLDVNGRQISLQSGMSVTANIKVREERSVMSLLTELFTKQIESLEGVR